MERASKIVFCICHSRGEQCLYFHPLSYFCLIISCTKIRPLLEYASQVWGGLPQYLADNLQSIQNRCLDIIGISRASLPTLEQRRMEATKRELERTIEDINHPNQVFFSMSSTSYSYNL